MSAQLALQVLSSIPWDKLPIFPQDESEDESTNPPVSLQTPGGSEPCGSKPAVLLVRCGKKSKNWQCQRKFPKPEPGMKKPPTRCLECRAGSKRYKNGTKGKVTVKRNNDISNAKESNKVCKAVYRDANRDEINKNELERKEERRNDPELHAHDQQVWADRREERRNDPDLHAHDQQVSAEWRASDKGKAANKRSNDKKMNRLAMSLCNMVNGTHDRPATFKALGLFEDNADAEAHFESTKTEPWMKDCAFGPRTKTTLPKTVLQIGHKIPKVWYRHDDEEEIKKCWSRQNLFAQCAVENHEAGDRNFLSREQWMALKPIWPKQCADMTDEQAWAWAVNNVDNATRKAERAAAKAAKTASSSGEAGPSGSHVADSEDEEDSEDSEDEEDEYDSVRLASTDDSGSESESD